MKKILALVLAALMLFAFAACENTNDEPAETDAPATDAPETDAPETDVPETDAPESGDTDTAYTQMDFMTEDLSKYIKLGQYKGLELAVERPTVTEEEIDYEIQAVIAELTKYEEYEEPVTDRATEKYDNLNIDFVGFMDGELFEGGSAEGATVVLAEDNGYLDWFDDDLYGVMPGTTVTTTNFFPEDAIESLAGKEVTFEITVNYIEGHYTVPEFTDEFIAENTEFNSVAEFKELVRLTIQSEKDAKFEEEKFNILFGAIIDNAEIIEYPEEQIMYYYTSEISYLEAYAANYGVTIDVLMEAQGITYEIIMDYVKNLVKEELVYFAIVKAEAMEVTDEDYSEGLARYSASMGVTAEELEAQYGVEYIKDNILWDKTHTYIASQNTFVEK